MSETTPATNNVYANRMVRTGLLTPTPIETPKPGAYQHMSIAEIMAELNKPITPSKNV